MAKVITSTAALAIFACILLSTAFAGIKIGLQYTSPLKFAGVRFMLAGLLVLPFCGAPGEVFAGARRNALLITQVALFQITLLYALFYLGLNMLPAAVTAIIIGAQPLIIALVAHFASTGERMTRRKAVSIAFGVVGVAVIGLDRGDFSLSGGRELLGIGLLLLSNVCAAVANITVSRRSMQVPPLMLNACQLLLGGGMLLVVGLLVEHGSTTVFCLPYFASLLWLSGISAGAMSIWFVLLRREGVLVSDLNVWKFLLPLSGACLSWLLVEGEAPDLASIIGMAFISTALAVLNLRRRRSQ